MVGHKCKVLHLANSHSFLTCQITLTFLSGAFPDHLPTLCTQLDRAFVMRSPNPHSQPSVSNYLPTYLLHVCLCRSKIPEAAVAFEHPVPGPYRTPCSPPFFSFLFFFFCRILVPQPGIEPTPLAVKAWSPNHWTAREFPAAALFKEGFLCGVGFA